MTSKHEFTPEDVIHAPTSAEASQADIAEALRGLMQGDTIDQRVFEQVAEASRYIQGVSLNVLRRLAEAGIDDAELVTERFLAASAEYPTPEFDLFSVAADYEADRATSPDPSHQRELERLSSLSRASGAISIAWAVGLVKPTGSQEAVLLVDSAQEILDAESPKMEQATDEALQSLIDEVRGLHSPPYQA